MPKIMLAVPKVSAKSNRPPIKPGFYLAEIIQTATKNISNNKGSMLEVRFKIIQGSSENRSVYDRFLIGHNNTRVTEIALQRLTRLLRALGLGNIDMLCDSEELHDIPLVIEVAIDQESKDYPDRNFVKRYYSAEKFTALNIVE